MTIIDVTKKISETIIIYDLYLFVKLIKNICSSGTNKICKLDPN